ncbi:RNA-directed DNA polymerase, eukaryota, reverse transcriptase zinc-binding domain protein [Tanacetum coccineum]
MPQGANSPFFTLIRKVSNPIFIKDFRLISLIGIHYKIITKILANRLSKVIEKIVSIEQSAFISGRQILDGPLILSGVIEWFRKRRKKMLIFKLDFKKAFDSVSWKYLDFVLHSLRFGLKININKSNIYGIGVSDDEVSNMARNSRCAGGQDSKKLIWIKWANVLSSFEKGGLNIGSLKSFNLALLQKWRWRWLSFPNALWVKVIKAIHGQEGGFDTYGCKFNACRVIGDKILPSLVTLTSWDKTLPRKVNIFMWRLMLDRLPHRLNLSSRGIDIQSISCSSCNDNVKSSNHIFLNVTSLWSGGIRWKRGLVVVGFGVDEVTIMDDLVGRGEWWCSGGVVITEYLVNISKRHTFWSLNEDILKIIVLTTNTPMDDSNITIEEYIRLEEEKARKRGKVFNWETSKYGRIWYDEDVHCWDKLKND